MSGNLQEVRMRLDLGEDVNQKLFPRFSTPLHDAIICGRIDVARELIQRCKRNVLRKKNHAQILRIFCLFLSDRFPYK